MQFLTDTHIDFMKYRKVFVWVSLALLIVSCAELFFLTGLNLGIDFAGGTQLTVRLRDELAIDDLRRLFEGAGQRDAQLQRFGSAADKEILIKTPAVSGSEEGSSGALLAALNESLNSDQSKGFDLNQRGTEALAGLLYDADPDGLRGGSETEQGAARSALYADAARALIKQRESRQLFDSWDQVKEAPGVSPAVFAALEDRADLGAFHVLQTENVGPQIGSELRRKGIMAVVLSLIGMLAYIWYRFELRFGIGAVIAVFHDCLITLGLFALFNFEFNLSTIAAFLTLVGYSVNDTVVIFDRVRENMRRHRRQSLVDIINLSLNQTLTRTILTSGTTLLTAGCLFLFGGEVIRGLAFVLLIGVLIGTYSSVFVASPFTLLWEQFFGDKKRRATSRSSTSKSVPAV